MYPQFQNAVGTLGMLYLMVECMAWMQSIKTSSLTVICILISGVGFNLCGM